MGGFDNLLSVYSRSQPWELEAGRLYYDKQYTRLHRYAHHYRTSVRTVIAAFAVLSPNTDEYNNYKALRVCLEIFAGNLPNSCRCAGYPLNQKKALAILRYGGIHKHLKGLKVRAFYHNTLDSTDPTYITVDGHVHAAWQGKRMTVLEAAVTSRSRYNEVANDIRTLSSYVGVPAPKLQATIWLTWKRIHNILYSPQLRFDYPEDLSLPFRVSYPNEDGLSTAKGTLSTPPNVQIPLFGVEHERTD